MPVLRSTPPGARAARLAALSAAAVLIVQPAAAERIGVASAVVPQAMGARPNAEAVVLRVGRDMVVNERVTTSEGGRAQLLFVDGSALMVGPNSDLVLDSYVFDADARTGEATFSAARGVFRLVGGKLTKSAPVTIRTPSATVGIRGGIALVEVGEGSTSATFLFGDQMTVTSDGVTKVAERPGYTIEVGSGAPSDPAPASAEGLAERLDSLEAPQEVELGVSANEEDVGDQQIGAPSLSARADAQRPPAAAGPIRTAMLTPAVGAALQAAAPAETTAASGIAVATATGCQGMCVDGLSGRGVRSDGAALAFANGSLGGGRLRAGGYDLFAPGAPGAFAVGGANQPAATPFGSVAGFGDFAAPDFVLYKLVGADGSRQLVFAGRPQNGVPASGIEAFQLDEDFLRQSNLPFIDPIAGAPGRGRAYIAWDASAPGAQRAFAGGAVVITGQGAAQKSGAFALTGSVLLDAQGRPFVSGRMDGFGRFAAQGPATLYQSAISTADGGDGSDFFGAPGQRGFVLQSAGVDAADSPLGGAVARKLGQSETTFAAAAAAVPAPYASAGRSSRTLRGFLSGVERSAAGGATYVKTKGGDAGNLTLATDAARNTLRAEFALEGDSTTNELRLRFGETAPAGKSAFIDDAAFVATAAGFTRNGAAIDGRGALISGAFLEQSGLLPSGVSFCACDYLVWGFVGADRQRSAAGAVSDRVALELAGFVAGELADANQLVGLSPQSATYQGHVFASVANGAGAATQYYSAVGSLTLGFSFGGGSYSLNSVAIANLDGASLSGSGSSAAFNGPGYSTTGLTVSGVHPTAGAVTASLEGAFFGPGAPPANAGGQAKVSGANYLAAGVFAAAKQ